MRNIKLMNKVIEKARIDPTWTKKAKIMIAAEFGLSTWEHVNLDKTAKYLQYLSSDHAAVERFLDEADEARRRFEVSESKKLGV
jgi:hypothetical protein